MWSRKVAPLLFLAATATFFLAEAPTASQRIGFSGFGEVHIGMSMWDLVVSLGQEVTVQPEDNDCTFVLPKGEQPGLSYMITHGTLARVDVASRGLATISGVRVGDTEDDVRAAYKGRLEVREHQYVDGHYMTVRSDDGRSAVVFETDGKTVTSFRIGRLPEALWIEGCS